jgi:MoaA/NifB/PqqE/SkfB family radical SAM enzyme
LKRSFVVNGRPSPCFGRRLEAVVMSLAVLAKSARNVLSAVEINFNRRVGREFIPVAPDMLCIETSSLCNLKCRFCAYEKKQSPRVSMKDELFQDCVRQALALGYRQFELTPCTGDVFMDRHIFNKLRFLQDDPGVECFQFFTNMTIPKTKDIERIFSFGKLKMLTVSVYGHDLDSFIAITKSTRKVYERLLSNLETLLLLLKTRKLPLQIGFRTTKDAPRWPVSDLQKLLQRFRDAGIEVRRSKVYNNWGGYVTKEDVKGLAIDVTSADAIYKNGACVKLFTSVQVMATGIVNGCACRDVDATLRIGDLNTTPLRDIISMRNPAYVGLIEEQQRGEFRPVCRSCDFYKSIYHTRSEYRREGTRVQSLDAFKANLTATRG